jgi:cytochrome c oxidase assembly protein subunit 11
MNDQPENPQMSRRHILVAMACCVFVASMVGAAYASVPLYRLFCQATGFGGTTQVGSVAPDKVLDRTILVRFDANVAPGLNWDFQPAQRQMEVKVGQTNLAFFRARNRSDGGQWGSATYNVTPEVTGGYFVKMHCFCFEKQHLNAGEELDMPVQFFVDPSMVEDKTLDGVNTITLSYTFYAAEPPASVAGVQAAPKL